MLSITKRYTNEELIVLLLNHMSFPNGVNDQITDAVTQTIQAMISSDESWLELLQRREQRVTEATLEALEKNPI
jgi:hypothetical protein